MHRAFLSGCPRRSRTVGCGDRLFLPIRRDGFTLIELLVAMTVSLILIFALAQAFTLVGEVVAEGRATIEMSGSLRSVANRLQQDVDGATAPGRPWLDPASGLGYLEISDGPSVDVNWNDDATLDTDPTVSDTTLGDIDDVLALTTRSKDQPFIGERTYVDHWGALDTTYTPPTVSVQSTLAEVVWWIQYDDAPVTTPGIMNQDGNGIYDAGEPFTIYRRQLLIRPDLGMLFNQSGATAPNRAYANNPTGLAELRSALIGFFNGNDISVRINWWIDGNGINVQLIANSLADLTNRENRFAHLPILSDRSTSGQYSLVPVASDGPWWALRDKLVFPHAIDLNRRSVTSLYRSPKTGANAGEDVMLVNALAFDVRVFDPEAAIRYDATTQEALTPGDPGYLAGITPPINTWPQVSPPTVRPAWLLGFGAFVDLGYGHGNTSSTARWPVDTSGVAAASVFSGAPAARSGLVPGFVWRTPCYCYDTWSTYYERNGVDEDSSGVVDQGTNGFDDDGTNGVDDVGERETSPPYPSPLRGIRVSIRAIEPDMRQVRQVSVMADFLPE